MAARSVDPRLWACSVGTIGRIGSRKSEEAEPVTGAVKALSEVDLVVWFAERGRSLPWRDSRDPWEILVAETMLQQTRVSRVIDRWRRFLLRFPDVSTCAGAAVGEVIDEWVGLGYNRRAVNLHRTSLVIATEHGGRFPTALPVLLAMPGIGPYTARAIRVFAFELDDAVLDTNVARVLARTAGASLPRTAAQHLADRLVPPGRGWAWNQAMLDVGALHCSARRPVCAGCPFAARCRWQLDGCPEPDPATGSAAVSTPQSRFAGSDREGRGRLVAALRPGPVGEAQLAAVMGWPDDAERARKVAATVVADGLAVQQAGVYRLPK